VFNTKPPPRIAIWNADIGWGRFSSGQTTSIYIITLTEVSVKSWYTVGANRGNYISKPITLSNFQMEFEELSSAKILEKYRRLSKR